MVSRLMISKNDSFIMNDSACCTLNSFSLELLQKIKPVTNYVLHKDPKVKAAYETGGKMYGGAYTVDQIIASTGSRENYEAYKKLYEAIKPLYELHLSQEYISNILEECSKLNFDNAITSYFYSQKCEDAILMSDANIDSHNLLYSDYYSVLVEVSPILRLSQCSLGDSDSC